MEMQHAFNYPYQIGTHSRDQPMKDAQKFSVGVEQGDIVVVGSDGLMDNLVRSQLGRANSV
jgi:protein phosphatase PTC7